MERRFGYRLKNALETEEIIPFIGVHDVFSAGIAGEYFNSIFVSGFSFSASYYGLPDNGFITWSDISGFAQRIRTILPNHHLLVDIDDGYCDVSTACHVVSVLESIGVSGIIIEDQKRPRKCGHFEGKQLLGLDAYLEKLHAILSRRKDLFVIARTDAVSIEEIIKRVKAFESAGADAILIDAIQSEDLIKLFKSKIQNPLVFNQIAGGKSPALTFEKLKDLGVSLIIYSTPCLFAAQEAIIGTMQYLGENNGLLPSKNNKTVNIQSCTAILDENIKRRDNK